MKMFQVQWTLHESVVDETVVKLSFVTPIGMEVLLTAGVVVVVCV